MYGRGGPAPGETVLDRYVVERGCLWCPRRDKPQPAMWPWLVSRSHNANHARIRGDVQLECRWRSVDWSNREVVR